MKLKYLISSLAIPCSLFLLASCSEQKPVETPASLQDITTSEIVRVTNIDLKKVKSVNFTSDLNQYKHKMAHHYVTMYQDDRHAILRFPTDLEDPSNPSAEVDDNLYLTIFTMDKLENLSKDYLAYENATDITFSASSLSTSLMQTSGKVYADSFYYLKSLENLTFRNFDFGATTNLDYLFAGLDSCKNLESVDFTGSKTSGITSTVGMFANTKIKTLEGFDTSGVVNMDYMFAYTNATELRLDSSFSINKAKSLSNMFRQTTYQLLDLAVLKPSRHLVDISAMFYESKDLATLNLADFTFTNDGLDLRNIFYYTGANVEDSMSITCTAPFHFSTAKAPSEEEKTKYNLTEHDLVISSASYPRYTTLVTGALSYAHTDLATVFN